MASSPLPSDLGRPALASAPISDSLRGGIRTILELRRTSPASRVMTGEHGAENSSGPQPPCSVAGTTVALSSLIHTSQSHWQLGQRNHARRIDAISLPSPPCATDGLRLPLQSQPACGLSSR